MFAKYLELFRTHTPGAALENRNYFKKSADHTSLAVSSAKGKGRTNAVEISLPKLRNRKFLIFPNLVLRVCGASGVWLGARKRVLNSPRAPHAPLSPRHRDVVTRPGTVRVRCKTWILMFFLNCDFATWVAPDDNLRSN